jgi:cobalamin biosynthesis protein CobT
VRRSLACTECNKSKIRCSFLGKYDEDPSTIMEEQLGMLVMIGTDQRASLEWIEVALREQADREAARYHQQRRLYEQLIDILGRISAVLGTGEERSGNGVPDKAEEEKQDEEEDEQEDEERESEEDEESEGEKGMSEKQRGKQRAK